MTQQEFQERTGIQSNVIFDIANDLYMGIDMDKDAFCMDFKSNGSSAILANYFKKCQELQSQLDAMKAQLADTAEFLLAKENETDDTTFRDKAAELISEKEVICLKIENGWDLNDDDKEYIKEHIL